MGEVGIDLRKPSLLRKGLVQSVRSSFGRFECLSFGRLCLRSNRCFCLTLRCEACRVGRL